MHMFRHRGTAVIVGISSRESVAYARRMADRGYDLILIGPDRERLQTAARRITDSCGCSVEALAEDGKTVTSIVAGDASITLLVNYVPSALRPWSFSEALMPGFLARGVGAVVEVTGKAQCPRDDALWTSFLVQWEADQASAH
jgi:NAD(P)-dependent dehydrogenase (short-subunit alcohol dehydrogenase family)